MRTFVGLTPWCKVLLQASLGLLLHVATVCYAGVGLLMFYRAEPTRTVHVFVFALWIEKVGALHRWTRVAGP